MPIVRSFEFTVGELADRLSACTGDTPAFHARQLRHWASQGVLDALGHSSFRGEGKTAARVFNTRHLAGAVLLHFYANQRSDVDFLTTAARLMRNGSFDHDDERVFKHGDGFTTPVAGDGLATAIHFARSIANGAAPGKWTIYLQLHLTRDGTLEGGTFTAKPRHGGPAFHWVESRVVNASALLPRIFRDQNGEQNELATASYNQGVAYDSTPICVDDLIAGHEQDEA